MLQWIAAICAGIALGLGGNIASPWVSFVLFLVVTIGLGVSAARAKPETAFWHGAALASTSSALTGLLTLVLSTTFPLRNSRVFSLRGRSSRGECWSPRLWPARLVALRDWRSPIDFGRGESESQCSEGERSCPRLWWPAMAGSNRRHPSGVQCFE